MRKCFIIFKLTTNKILPGMIHKKKNGLKIDRNCSKYCVRYDKHDLNRRILNFMDVSELVSFSKLIF